MFDVKLVCFFILFADPQVQNSWDEIDTSTADQFLPLPLQPECRLINTAQPTVRLAVFATMAVDSRMYYAEFACRLIVRIRESGN